MVADAMPLLSTLIAPHIHVRKTIIEGPPESREDVTDVASTL